MEVLKFNQFLFTLSGLDSLKDKSKTVTFLNLFQNIVFCSIESSGVIFSLIYALINIGKLVDFVAGILAICCFSFANGMLYNAVFHKEKYRNVVNCLENLVEKRCIVSSKIYENVEQKCRKYTRLLFLLSVLPYTAIVMSSLIVVAVYSWLGKYRKSLWFFSFDMYSVIELNTDFRIFLFFLYQYIACSLGLLIIFTVVCFYQSVCLYTFTLVSDLKSLFSSLNGTKGSIRTRQQLIEIVEFHNSIAKFINEFIDLMSGYILTSNLSLIGALCVCLYQFQQYGKEFDIGVFLVILEVFVIVLVLFLFCYFGNEITDRCTTIGDAAYNNSLWYNFSMDHQKFIIMILIRSQKKFYFTGRGFMPCTMENFMVYVKTSVTAYMVLKTV